MMLVVCPRPGWWCVPGLAGVWRFKVPGTVVAVAFDVFRGFSGKSEGDGWEDFSGGFSG